MSPAVHLLAPLLMLLPAAVSVEPPSVVDARGASLAEPPLSRGVSSEASVEQPFGEGWAAPDAGQVRIEQRVTIRITPRAAPMPMAPTMFDQDQLEGGGGPRFSERKLGKCLPIAGIAGVQPAPSDRLLLIMRDQRMITAQLGKGCRSRDYYSGFLVAKNADGMICTGRDALLSRSGANCQVHTFRQLVPQGN